jgi:hypothetical protein
MEAGCNFGKNVASLLKRLHTSGFAEAANEETNIRALKMRVVPAAWSKTCEKMTA